MENIVFNIQLVKKKKMSLQKMKTFLKPGLMSSLTPRSPLRMMKKISKNEQVEEVGPEIKSLSKVSKDLIRPYSIRTKEYAAISNSSQIMVKQNMTLPKLPPSQIRLKSLKMKVREFDFVQNEKNSFLSIKKVSPNRVCLTSRNEIIEKSLIS
jgi:hypothetical protein